MKNIIKHFIITCQHKWLVFVHCCKVGLVWRGLVHDLSKFSPTEFFESAKYVTGTGSPIAQCRKTNGYSKAWLHHKGRNKHHIEYWYDKQNKVQMNIPFVYAVETVCDKLAATKVYNGKNFTNGSLLAHWNKHRELMQTNEAMLAFFDKVFLDLSNHGEKFILNRKYLRQVYNETVTNPK